MTLAITDTRLCQKLFIVLVVMKLPNWCNIGMMRRRSWSKKIETVTGTVLVVVIMNSFVESIVFQGN